MAIVKHWFVERRKHWRSELFARPQPHFVAWFFTVLSLWILFGAAHTTRLFEIPADVLLLHSTLVALIWTAYHAFKGVEVARQEAERVKHERENTRDFLANAVVVEVHYLMKALESVQGDLSIYDSSAISRPRLIQAVQRADLFAPAIGGLMTQADSRLRVIEANIRLWRIRSQSAAAHDKAFSERLEQSCMQELEGIRSGAMAALEAALERNLSPSVLALRETDRTTPNKAAEPVPIENRTSSDKK